MAFLVKRPLLELDGRITTAWRDVIRAFGRSISHVLAGEPHEIVADLAELAAGIKTEPQQSDVAWLLIRRSLAQALATLIREHRELFLQSDMLDQHRIDEAERALDLDNEVLELDERFFRDPGSLDILAHIRAPLAAWLTTCGLDPASANALAERLRPYFVLALHDEWARAPADYAQLRDAVDTPFTRAQDIQRSWLRYKAHLRRIVNEPMFAEPFGLQAVYIPLRAFWERRTNDGKRVERVVISLAEACNEWLAKNSRDDALRVLSGGPGSGKSSFTRMYAAETMEKGQIRVLHVPLHVFDPKGDLVTAIGDYVRMSRVLPSNPLDVPPGDEPARLLIIFDGLDELAMQGKLAAETARQFVQEVDKTLYKLNQMQPWLSVLISGRELIVQANETEFRKPGQILHLLPYYSTGPAGETRRHLTDTSEWEWEDSQELLSKDQRHDWWQRYRAVTRVEPETIPGEFLQGELGDVTRQPLLLYLVALSFSRKTLDVGPNTNLNDVYADLIGAVWERAYDGRRRFLGIQNLTKKDFVRVLEEIGLAAWHDERRTTTVRAIRDHFESGGLTRLLDAFEQGAEAGVTRLLTAFYFRQHGEHDGEKTFEFTHKSFGEYLAACRIVRTLAVIDRAIADHEDDPDRGKDTVDALADWAEVCGPSALDEYYVMFLRREISGRASEVLKWQQRLAAMITISAKTGLPMERVKPRPSTFGEELRRARNGEEALFVCAAACGNVTQLPTTVNWPTPVTSGAWIRRLQGQRTHAQNAIITTSLCWLDLSNCFLHVADLYGADLTGARLQGTLLRYACLEEAILFKANMSGAYISPGNLARAFLASTNLSKADMKGANLKGANLEHANLEGANLEGANLEHANLEGANLEGANLEGANLKHAKLQTSNLEYANLERTILEHADLSDANLSGANLQYARLSYGKLRRSNMQDTNLERAKLVRAKLQHANLEHARLQHANLEHANLEHANLEHARLQHANLEHANLEHANLEYANLEHANLEYANLEHANLEHANLRFVNLHDVRIFAKFLKNADFRGARLRSTLFLEDDNDLDVDLDDEGSDSENDSETH